MIGKFKILFLAILFLTFFAGEAAFASFNDEENSAGNVYSAGALDFSLDSPEDFSPEITPSTTSSRNISIINEGTLPFKYQITLNNVPDNLCGYLTLKVELGGVEKYNGSIIDGQALLSDPLPILNKDEQNDWTFTITLNNNDSALQDQSCNFDLVFDGVQLGSCSGFSDIEILSNIINSGVWEETPPEQVCGNYIVEGNETCDDGNTDDGDGCNSVCQLEDLTPLPGEIIINEVMWMGSEDIGNPSYDGPKDQWVEIKNVSNRDLQIKDRYLTYLSNAGNENKLVEIGNNRIIHPGEFFLISYYTHNNSAIDVIPDDHSMSNFDYEDFQIKLYTDNAKTVLIDTAGSGLGEPTVGDKNNFYSMERNDIQGDGTDYNNWHTCLDSDSTILYWDSWRTEQGTPGATNLSANDPSSDDYQENEKVEKFEDQAENIAEENNEKDADKIIEDEEREEKKIKNENEDGDIDKEIQSEDFETGEEDIETKEEKESDGAVSKEEGDASDAIMQEEEFGNDDGDGDGDDDDGDSEEENKDEDKSIDGIQLAN